MQEYIRPNFVIVTGLSGAGKSQVMKCFEDQNYYCVDNLPPVLIPDLIKLCHNCGIFYLAIALDVRNKDFFADLTPVLKQVEEMGQTPYIVFLEASDDVLIHRYAESRRQHPLAPNDRAANGILKERKMLKFLKDRASLVLDTSKTTSHQLRGIIFQHFNPEENFQNKLHIVSFGFKHGAPTDVDLIFDCRFLPNPYYIANLRQLSGLDEPVREYLHNFETYHIFAEKIIDLLTFLLPQYLKEGKRQVNVAFGCTGGRHRSVALAEEIAQAMIKQHYETSVEHRDIKLSAYAASSAPTQQAQK